MTRVKIVLILTENWTMRPTPDVGDLVRFAVEAERAGLDAVMVSEHIVLGPSSGAAGLPANPRDYALPGNQDPATPWPSPLVLLSAIAAATTRIRLVASALISPPSWMSSSRCGRKPGGARRLGMTGSITRSGISGWNRSRRGRVARRCGSGGRACTRG
jgi:hypothetical protein